MRINTFYGLPKYIAETKSVVVKILPAIYILFVCKAKRLESFFISVNKSVFPLNTIG